MKKLVLFAALILAGCGPSRLPLTDAEVSRMRASAEPNAQARCAAFGFTNQTPFSISQCVNSSVASYMESQVPWTRLEASGLNFTGNEEVEAIALCVGKGIDPTSTQMPACFQAERILAVRRQNQNAQEQNMRAAQIRAMSAPVRVAPQTCIRNGAVTNCF